MTEPHALTAPSQTLAELTRELNAWVELDLARLEANVVALRRWVGHDVELIAVVKANAYGHGTAIIAPALERFGIDRFAVFSVPEGIQLRELGISRPVLVLGHAYPRQAADAVSHDLTLTVDEPALAQALVAAAQAHGRRPRVHIKVDTGLHRFGLPPHEAVALAEWLRTLPEIEVEGLWTHMANADEADDSFSDEQQARFEETARRLDWIPYRHAANSATAIRRATLRYHGVRTGIGLLGVVPPNTENPGIRPVLALKARLVRIAEVAAGEGVSYGLTWRARRPSRIGLVPIGYGDGWPRSLSNCGEVLVRGQRAPVVGRVCMDQFLVDVTDIPGASSGDEVVLIGEQGKEHIGAEDVARLAGTIPWDIVASLQPRIPRIAHRGCIVEAILGTL